jgi:hypothetical protein
MTARDDFLAWVKTILYEAEVLQLRTSSLTT